MGFFHGAESIASIRRPMRSHTSPARQSKVSGLSVLAIQVIWRLASWRVAAMPRSRRPCISSGRPLAAWAVRGREHDRLAFARQAKDDHIQKRADNGSENSGKTDQQWFHLA